MACFCKVMPIVSAGLETGAQHQATYLVAQGLALCSKAMSSAFPRLVGVAPRDVHLARTLRHVGEGRCPDKAQQGLMTRPLSLKMLMHHSAHCR